MLNSYGGLLAERGRYAEAQDMFERAIAAKPDHPNPYLGLAMVARKQGDEDAALAALERLFAQSGGDTGGADARSEPVYAEARRIYAACAPAAPSAWPGKRPQDRAGVALRAPLPCNSPCTGGGQSHLVAHEFAHILLDEALRAEGVNKLFADNDETRRRALGAVDKDVRKIQARRKLPAAEMARLVDGMLQSLTSQLFNTPLDLFIERRHLCRVPGACVTPSLWTSPGRWPTTPGLPPSRRAAS